MVQKKCFQNSENITMNFQSKKIIAFLFLLLVYQWLNAQIYNLKFENLTTKQGLSNNVCRFIVQDKKGFIWISTEEGLNKYDGYNFTIYKADKKLKNAISDSYTTNLEIDKDGALWVGTSTLGLNKFDLSNDKIISYFTDINNSNSLTSNQIRGMKFVQDGALIIGTAHGLNIFKDGKFSHFTHNPKDTNSLTSNNIYSIVEEKDGTVWIGTENGGLNRMDRKTGIFTRFVHNAKDTNSISNNFVTSLFIDSYDVLWAGTYEGLNRYDKQKGIFVRYTHGQGNGDKFPSNRINCIAEYQPGVLLIGTINGLSFFEINKNYYTNYYHDELDARSLTNSNIIEIYKDRSGIFWIGTLKGINILNPNNKKFKHIQRRVNQPNSLPHNTIRALCEDKQGLLWIGTINDGLSCFNPQTYTFTNFSFDERNPASLSGNQIVSILIDHNHTLWVGTWGKGLNKCENYDVKKKNANNLFFRKYNHKDGDKGSLADDIIQALYLDRFNHIWVGTESGLCLYDSKNDRFVTFKANESLPNSLCDNKTQSGALLLDSRGYLWVGTWNGMSRSNFTISASDSFDDIVYKANTIGFCSFRNQKTDTTSISDSRIIAIFEDKSQNIWVGTFGNGINKVIRPEAEASEVSFVRYTQNNGLPNNTIFGILDDSKGNLWLSTNYGLCKFNPTTKKIHAYTEEDGLQDNQFYWSGAVKSKTGELIFGGVNGISIFSGDNQFQNF